MLLLLLACDGPSDSAAPVDADGDGIEAWEDCDDQDGTVYPTAPDDTCDGVDQDCDGVADDESPDASFWYPDTDGDGYGRLEAGVLTCEPPEGYGRDFTDCDDADARVHPGAAEDVCDGVDSDCDGDIDEDAAAATTFYADADGDGHGDPFETITACAPPEGFAASDDDCEDDSTVAPTGEDVCGDGVDGDCDGLTDPGCGDGLAVDLYWAPVLSQEDDLVNAGSHRDGVSLAAGDFDGDGGLELALGVDAGGEDYGGRVYVLGDVPTEDGALVAAANRVIDGERGSGLGYALAAVSGDPSGDTLVVGAPYAHGVFVFAPGTGSVGVGDASASFVGEADSRAGYTVADAGGLLPAPGIAIGAPHRGDEGGGAVYLAPIEAGEHILEDDAVVLWGEVGACAGAALAVGDLDGDGVDDLAVGGVGEVTGSEGEAGTVWVVRGPIPASMDLADADARIDGAEEAGMLGFALVLEDLDADGRIDLVASAPDARSNEGGDGIVYGFTSVSDGVSSAEDAPIGLTAAGTDGYAGASLAAPGDLDGDGGPDLLVGVPYAFGTRGYYGGVRLVSDLAPGTRSLADSLLLTGRGGGAGSAVGTADLDGDGALELGVGGTEGSQEPALSLVSTAGWYF